MSFDQEQPQKIPERQEAITFSKRMRTRQQEYKFIIDKWKVDEQMRQMLMKGFKRFVPKSPKG